MNAKGKSTLGKYKKELRVKINEGIDEYLIEQANNPIRSEFELSRIKAVAYWIKIIVMKEIDR